MMVNTIAAAVFMVGGCAVWLLCVIAGGVIGIQKNRDDCVVYSFLLGPLGVFVAICLQSRYPVVYPHDEMYRQLRRIGRDLRKVSGESKDSPPPPEPHEARSQSLFVDTAMPDEGKSTSWLETTCYGIVVVGILAIIAICIEVVSQFISQ